MKSLLLFLASWPLLATNQVNFLNLRVTHEQDGLWVHTEPEPLVAYKLLRDENYSLDKNLFDHVLDGPFRQTAFLLRTLERNRGSIYSGNGEPLPIIRYKFELAVRDETGKSLTKKEYKVSVGLAGETGQGIIQCPEANLNHTFPIQSLTNDKDYGNFVSKLAFPFDRLRLPTPPRNSFLIDLYYHWPDVVVDEDDFNVFDLFPSAILWDRGYISTLEMHLGTTYIYRSNDQWKQVNSEFLRAHKHSIDEYSDVLSLLEEGDSEEIIDKLEAYITRSPSDRKALKNLMDAYLDAGKEAEAYDLITRFQPFFATIREGIANKNQLAEEAQKKRNLLLGKRARFTKNAKAKLEITSPEEYDLVTGTTDLRFTMAGNEARILSIDCYLDDELIAHVLEPPFEVPFTVDGSYGRKNLRVVAYFEDETFIEDQVRIETFRVDEEESVNLVGLQVSVFQDTGKAAKVLTKEDFSIRENKEQKEIAHFRRSTAPLRIAILLDTSISMFGEKLYQTQYAVKTFLSKLEQEDRAAIYSFDSKVLKLTDFTNDFDEIVTNLMTLSPHGNTSLYDGMLIAHDALIGQNGTKVMIVISDGSDTGSVSTDIHVAKVLRTSPVMVYSIVLPDNQNPRGNDFLKEMSKLSGSTFTKVRSVDNLNSTFDRIYEDLKNLYFLDFYSSMDQRAEREIRVKLKGRKSTIRHRRLN